MFVAAQEALGIPRGSIRATVLIETIPAAFEMDEILYELREHAAGLNAGRWDYLFSCIKKFRSRPDLALPDRAQLTMAVPFMRAYTELLVRTCHRRGAHAIGGMAAFIPSRRDAAVNEVGDGPGDRRQGARVGRRLRRHLGRPSRPRAAGHEIFDGVLGSAPNQKERLREDVEVSAADLLNLHVDGGHVTEAGVRLNVSVALAVPRRLAAGQRRGRDQQPDGGRRHGRDQPLAALAVADDRRDPRRWPLDHRRPVRHDPRRGAGARLGGARPAAWPRRPSCSTASSSTTTFAEFLTLGAYTPTAIHPPRGPRAGRF